MSYQPTIIIRKSDLEKHRNHIENAEWDIIPKKRFRGNGKEEKRERLTQAYRRLANALKIEAIKFPEIELVILDVETASRNEDVRILLEELNICYRLNH